MAKQLAFTASILQRSQCFFLLILLDINHYLILQSLFNSKNESLISCTLVPFPEGWIFCG